MKYLIVYAHPDPLSFNHAIREHVEAALKKQEKQYSVRDLYLMKWNPVMGGADFQTAGGKDIPEEVKVEQQYIKEADVIIFIHPIWWFGMPAVLKGYVDRVFSAGFAYEYTSDGIKGMLTGKKVMIVNTTGGPQESYEKFGFKDALNKVFKDGTYGFCAMEVIKHLFFYAVPTISNADREKMLEQIDSLEF